MTLPQSLAFSSSQVLVPDETQFEWLSASGGSVPSGAIQGGRTKAGETLYIGRALHDRELIVGKVHPSNNCLYIAYDGKEYRYEQYEVFVCKIVNFWASDAKNGIPKPKSMSHVANETTTLVFF